MKKHILTILILAGFVVGISGCTSNKVDQETADTSELTSDAVENDSAAAPGGDEVSELGDDFGGEGDAQASTEKSEETDGDGAAASDAATDDLAGLDAIDESTKEAKPDELATNDGVPGEIPPTDATASEAPSDSALAETTAPQAVDETQGLSEPPVEKVMLPLRKMETTPYTKSGILVNALYVARKGDTLKSISNKIFGENKSADLKKTNAFLANRSVKVGDKIYYNSPQRPTDSSQILTYYEDKGLAPEIYLAQPGDNIHEVAKKLLGDTNSWKEIWVTNLEVESKGELAEGTRLRYWSNETEVAPAVATAATTSDMAAAPPAPPMESGDVGQPGEPPPMPDQALAQNAAPSADVVPPPPAMADQQAAVPPPPPAEIPAEQQPNPEVTGALGEDPDQLMALGAGAVLLLAAVALFVIIRKKRAKRGIDFQTATHTQID